MVDTKNMIRAGVLLIIVGIAAFLFLYEGLGNFLSVSPSTTPGLSFTISSSNPNHNLIFASISGISQLAVSHTYNWSLTIHNTGTLEFSPHLTIRIADPNSTTITEPGDSAYIGADSGTGLIQVCPDGSVNSTQCLVDLSNWDFTATTQGESISATSPILAVVPGNGLEIQPGQSVTVYFSATVPEGTPSGTYKVISNLVAYAPSVGSDVIDYQSSNLYIGTVAGTYSLEVLGAIGTAAAGLALVAEGALRRRK
jgi:hypothetical protein